jgi:hypothetical protein
MEYLVLINIAVAISMAVWLRALLLARGADIPCTMRLFSRGVVAIAVLSIFGIVALNAVVMHVLDNAFDRALSPALITAWMAAMTAAALLFIAAISTRHTNRAVAAWIRLAGAGEVIFRVGVDSKTVKLEPGSVRALGVVQGLGGHLYVQYLVRARDMEVPLVVPFTRDAKRATEGAPWLTKRRGIIAQAGAREIHRHFAPFCEPACGPPLSDGSRDGRQTFGDRHTRPWHSVPSAQV